MEIFTFHSFWLLSVFFCIYFLFCFSVFGYIFEGIGVFWWLFYLKRNKNIYKNFCCQNNKVTHLLLFVFLYINLKFFLYLVVLRIVYSPSSKSLHSCNTRAGFKGADFWKHNFSLLCIIFGVEIILSSDSEEGCVNIKEVSLSWFQLESWFGSTQILACFNFQCIY